MPPSDVTVSTRSSASPFWRPTLSTSLRTPVEVSAWTRAITAGVGWAATSWSGLEGLAPGRVDPDHLGIETVGHLAHAFAEDAVHADHHDVTGPDER